VLKNGEVEVRLDAVNLKHAADYPFWFPVISLFEWPSINPGRTDQTQHFK
jgi:hypothetical protein